MIAAGRGVSGLAASFVEDDLGEWAAGQPVPQEGRLAYPARVAGLVEILDDVGEHAQSGRVVGNGYGRGQKVRADGVLQGKVKRGLATRFAYQSRRAGVPLR